jgi:hypothetical protein
VAPAFDGDEQIMRTRESYGVDHIRHPGTAGDQARALVDTRVPDLPGVIVTSIARLEHQSVEAGLELRDDGTVERIAIALLQLIFSHVASSTGVFAESFFVTAGACLAMPIAKLV